MSNYKVEFPDFGELDVVVPTGFVDTSEWNDACPSFALYHEGTSDVRLKLSIDYADKSLSDLPDTWKRFYLFDGADEQLLCTDDWVEMSATIEQLR